MVYYTVLVAFILPMGLTASVPNPIFIYFVFIFEFAILIDIIIAFRTTILDSEGEQVRQASSIARAYVLSRIFFIDVASILTFALLLSPLRRARYLMLLKLLQLRRIPKLLNQMNTTQQCKYLYKFLFLTVGLLMFYNLAAFIVFSAVHQSKNWIPPVDQRDPALFNYFGEPWAYRYLMAFYYAGVLMNGGNISPTNTSELASASFLMLAGMILHANVFGQMAMYINNMKMKEQRMNELMDRVITTMKNLGLKKSAQNKVRHFLLSTSSTQMQQEQFNNFLNMISPSLRDIVREQLYLQALRDNPIIHQIVFQTLEDQASFNRFLAHKMEVLLTSPQDVVIQYQAPSKAMFFIVSGTCRVLQRRREGMTPFRTLRESDHFGELGLLFKTRRTTEVVSQKYCTIAQLSDDHFAKVTSEVPTLRKELISYSLGYKDKLKKVLMPILSSLPYFRYLVRLDLFQILCSFKVEVFKEGEMFLKPGDLCEYLCIVVSGFMTVELSIDDELQLPLMILHRGHVLNFDGMVSPHKWKLGIRVEKTVCVAMLHRSQLLQFVDSNHSVGQNFHAIQKQIEQTELRPYPLDVYYSTRVEHRRGSHRTSKGDGGRSVVFKFKNAVIRILEEKRDFNKKFSLKEKIIAQQEKEKLEAMLAQANIVNKKEINRSLSNAFPDYKQSEDQLLTPMGYSYLYKVTSKITEASKFQSFMAEHSKITKTLGRLLLILKKHSKLLLFLQSVCNSVVRFHQEVDTNTTDRQQIQALERELQIIGDLEFSQKDPLENTLTPIAEHLEVAMTEEANQPPQLLHSNFSINKMCEEFKGMSTLQTEPQKQQTELKESFDKMVKELDLSTQNSRLNTQDQKRESCTTDRASCQDLDMIETLFKKDVDRKLSQPEREGSLNSLSSESIHLEDASSEDSSPPSPVQIKLRREKKYPKEQ